MFKIPVSWGVFARDSSMCFQHFRLSSLVANDCLVGSKCINLVVLYILDVLANRPLIMAGEML